MPTGIETVIVDTSVISILMRNEESAPFYRGQLSGKRALISFQTLEELWFGATEAGWRDRRKTCFGITSAGIRLSGPTLRCEISARLRRLMERQGRRLQTADAWIAATALLLRSPLATHDRDFQGIPDLVLIEAAVPGVITVLP